MAPQTSPDPHSADGARRPVPGADPCAHGGGPPVVHLRGELDLSTQASTLAALQRWTAAHALLLVVVTSDVTFVDCCGLRPLRETAEALAASGGLLELRSPSRNVLRLVQLSGTSPGLVVHGGP